MLLTAAMRASLKHAPGFLVVKPEYGSGASTLCSLAHIVLTGNHAAVLGTSRGGDELTKTLDAIQMAALPAIVLDNVQRGAGTDSYRTVPASACTGTVSMRHGSEYATRAGKR